MPNYDKSNVAQNAAIGAALGGGAQAAFTAGRGVKAYRQGAKEIQNFRGLSGFRFTPEQSKNIAHAGTWRALREAKGRVATNVAGMAAGGAAIGGIASALELRKKNARRDAAALRKKNKGTVEKSMSDFLISKSLRDLAAFADAVDYEIEKRLPSVMRAGGGGAEGMARRSMNMTGRANAREIANIRRTGRTTDGRSMDPNVAAQRARGAFPGGNPRESLNRSAARRQGMLTPNISQSASPALLERGAQLAPKTQAASDGASRYTNRKAALDRVTRRRQELQARMRPVQIQSGTAQRPAF